ncbi:Flagellar hook-length control protein [Reinekea sp. MED297]|uniref:Flagellar hook-length control protein n=2 Tax=Reinekea TaxID=230494 RepID=A4BIN9_9GAMM|nr:Flagellar hook-length control protein [Reinekea sp. MED297] [Reinekea blandensis MED297]
MALFQQFGSGDALTTDEQDFAALIRRIEQESGEKFPLDTLNALLKQEGYNLFESGLLPVDDSPGLDLPFHSQPASPEQLTGDELLSYLMANPKESLSENELTTLQSQLKRIIQALETADGVTPISASEEEGSEASPFNTVLPLLKEVQEWLSDLFVSDADSTKESEGVDLAGDDADTLVLSDSPLASSIATINQTVIQGGQPLSTEDKDSSPDVKTIDPLKPGSGEQRPESAIGLRFRADGVPLTKPADVRIESSLEGVNKVLGSTTEPDSKPIVMDATLKTNSVEADKPTVIGELRNERSAPVPEQERSMRLDAMMGDLTADERNALELGPGASRVALSKTADAPQLMQNLAEQMARPMKLQEAAQALTDRIQTMVAGGLQRAVIRLDPPELGALELRVHVQNDQTQVQIISPSPQVREALEQNSVRLREALAQQGLDLTHVDVSDQHRQTGSDSSNEGRNQSDSGDSVVAEDELIDEAPVQSVRQGLVDHYI